MLSENIHGVHRSSFNKNPKNGEISLSSQDPVVQVRGLARSYASPGRTEFHALQDVSLSIARGVSVALVGPSGSGKSTLLNLIAGLDRPSAGQISVAGLDLVGKSEDELSRHRGRCVGVVFQFFQLLPTLTTLENILLPMELVGLVPPRERRARALALLERFEVADQANKFPTTLSGGQQQRVAVARALANDPPLLVADEPTGNLDSRTAGQVMELLSELSEMGRTVIMATHETQYLNRFQRVVRLRDGKVVDDANSVSGQLETALGGAPC